MHTKFIHTDTDNHNEFSTDDDHMMKKKSQMSNDGHPSKNIRVVSAEQSNLY